MGLRPRPLPAGGVAQRAELCLQGAETEPAVSSAVPRCHGNTPPASPHGSGMPAPTGPTTAGTVRDERAVSAGLRDTSGSGMKELKHGL